MSRLTDTVLAPLRQLDPERTGPEAARIIEGTYGEASLWAESHLAQIGIMISGTLLSLYWGKVTQALFKLLKGSPFPLRAGAFVVVIGLGSGAIVATVAPFVASMLSKVGTYYVIPTTLGVFIVVGMLAELNERI